MARGLRSLTGVLSDEQISTLGLVRKPSKRQGEGGGRALLAGSSRTHTGGSAALKPGGAYLSGLSTTRTAISTAILSFAGGAANLAGHSRTLVRTPAAGFTPGAFTGGNPGAANFRYVNRAKSTNGDGMSWATAFNVLPATLVRGCVYYVTAGNYGARTFNTPPSGTQLITIRKATIEDHGEDISVGGWNSSMADGQAQWTSVDFTTSHWLWDGATGGGPGSWESGFGFRVNQTTDYGIELKPAGAQTNITCRHFEVIGIRHQTAGADGIHIGNIEPFGAISNFTCSYFKLDQISLCPFFLAPGTNNGAVNLVFEYGYVGVYGDLSNNDHSEVCSAWAGAGNITFRYNIFTYVYSTGGIMQDARGGPGGMYVYGNVFVRRAGGATWDYPNGVLGSWAGGETVLNYKVYNNTFVDISAPSGSGSIFGGSGVVQTGNEIRNNLFVNCTNVGGGTGLFPTKTNNHFINAASFGTSATTSPSGTNPFTSKAGLDFTLTMALGNGFALGSPYTLDALGHVRGAATGWSGADGTWDAGAYERVTP